MIIGLTGLAGCGKDTIASHLKSRDPYGTTSYAMASPLKKGLSLMLNIPLEDIEDPKLKNKENYKFDRSIRYMAQTLGTEWGRNLINENLWTMIAKENIENLYELYPTVIITDVRFDNEAALIKEMDGIVIQVIRADNPYTKYVSTAGVNAHVSENGLTDDMVDFIVMNNSTVEDLINRVDYFL